MSNIHTTTIQVRFADVDKLGHVNNAKYLTYFEIARMQFFKDEFKIFQI
jgi:acyl-CoA thioester hydrolase